MKTHISNTIRAMMRGVDGLPARVRCIIGGPDQEGRVFVWSPWAGLFMPEGGSDHDNGFMPWVISRGLGVVFKEIL